MSLGYAEDSNFDQCDMSFEGTMIGFYLIVTTHSFMVQNYWKKLSNLSRKTAVCKSLLMCMKNTKNVVWISGEIVRFRRKSWTSYGQKWHYHSLVRESKRTLCPPAEAKWQRCHKWNPPPLWSDKSQRKPPGRSQMRMVVSHVTNKFQAW